MVGLIVRASLKYRGAVLVGALLLVAFGIFAGTRLDIDVLPEVGRPSLVVMTEAGGLAAEETETLVTQPIELALTSLPAALRQRATSAVGLSVVTIELDWGADILAARQQVAERLAAARAQLPAGVAPQVQPVSSIMGEIMLIALTASGTTDAMALRSLADWTLRPRLAAIPGVSQVTAIGGEIRQMRIAPVPALMAALDISVTDIERAVGRFGTNAGGGFVSQGSAEFIIRSVAPVADPDTLGSVVVTTRNGTPIRLRHVARVDVAARPARGSAAVDGNTAVILSVQKQPGADTLALTRAVKSALAELQQTMPAGVTADRVIFQQADFIASALGNVSRALVESSLVVAVVLFLFLATLRTTLISLIAIPLSLLAAIAIFRLFGLSLNAMTLGGLAIAIGALVDDAVVDVENVFRRLKENRARQTPLPIIDVVATASQEVRSGILYATIIIILVLLPLFALAGLEGQLFRPLAFAYVVAIAASLVVALTITPVLCAWLLRHARVFERREAPLARWFKQGLARSLPFVLARPRAAIGTAALAVVLAAIALVTLPRSLMPPFNEGSLTVELSAQPGITLADSSRLGAIAEKLLLEIPEVASVGRRTGRAELDEHAQGIEVTEIDASLKPSGRTRGAIMRDVRERLSVLPVALNVGQPISHRIDHLLSGVRAQIVLKVVGEDLDTAGAVTAWLKAELDAIPGLVDVQVEPQARVPTIELRADDKRAALYGISPQAMGDSVASLAGGRTLSQVIEQGRRTEVTLRLADNDRTSTGLSRLLVETPQGRVPLKLLGEIAEADGRNRIERENGQRRLAVFANTEGRDVARTVSEVKAAIASLSLPPGFSVTLEGSYFGQEQAARRVLLIGLFSLAAVFALLLARYHSAVLALIVITNVPLSLIGGVAALAITGVPLSLASVVGFVTLAGISVRNGILKISHYLNLALIEGVPFDDALVLRGSVERLTPVLMTAFAAAFALLPLLGSAEPAGKEVLHPVAVVVFGGLISATLFDTFLTPLLFRRFGERPLARLALVRGEGEQAIAM
jgi:HME family heavy-metal exporter